jgi:hypothetical protein
MREGKEETAADGLRHLPATGLRRKKLSRAALHPWHLYIRPRLIQVPRELPTAGESDKWGGTNTPANGGFWLYIYKGRASRTIFINPLF